MFEDKKKDKSYFEFWKVLEMEKFPALVNCAQKLLSIFASTYMHESTFSKLKFIKNEYRSRLTNENVDTF